MIVILKTKIGMIVWTNRIKENTAMKRKTKSMSNWFCCTVYLRFANFENNC